MIRLAIDQSPAHAAANVAKASDFVMTSFALERPELVSHAASAYTKSARAATPRFAGVEDMSRVTRELLGAASDGTCTSTSAGGSDSLGSRKRSCVLPTRSVAPGLTT